MPKWYEDRKPATLVLITIVGLLMGSFISESLLHMPDNVVRTVFTAALPFSIGYPEPLMLDLTMFKFQIGLHVEFTLLSFVGVAIALWVYRWYK